MDCLSIREMTLDYPPPLPPPVKSCIWMEFMYLVFLDLFNLAAARELPFVVTSGLSFTSVQTAGADWLADAANPFWEYSML